MEIAKEKGVSDIDDAAECGDSHDLVGVGDGSRCEDQQPSPLGVKLRRRLAAAGRGGYCTPVPSWKLDHTSHAAGAGVRQTAAEEVSARKLGASLWGIQEPLPPVDRMSRRARRAMESGRGDGNGGEGVVLDASPLTPLDKPRSAGGWRRHVTASLIQQPKLMERNSLTKQPLSPANYSGSMEPCSSTSKGRIRETQYSIKTSTELLKVLNRIWSLEEQHASNALLVKELKIELQKAYARIKELVREQKEYHREIDDLMKQVVEDKLKRKSKEQDRERAAVQSFKDELHHEIRLRKHWEGMHCKLNKQFSEVKAALSKAVKELGKQRKGTELLGDLCDELAKGIKDYEQEVHCLKQKCAGSSPPKSDRLILHISEAWLDERLQTKIAETQDGPAANAILERLSGEIISFLRSKHSNSSVSDTIHNEHEKIYANPRRHSLESVHLHGAASAPKDAEDDDSLSSGFNCIELNVVPNGEESHNHFDNGRGHVSCYGIPTQAAITKYKAECRGKIKGQGSAAAVILNEDKSHHSDRAHEILQTESPEGRAIVRSQTESIPLRPEKVHREGGQSMKPKQDCLYGSTHLLPNSTEDPSVISIENSAHSGNGNVEGSHKHLSPMTSFAALGDAVSAGDFRILCSPMSQRHYHNTSPVLAISECSSSFSRRVKGNTLKDKLIEARLEGKHARLRASKRRPEA